MTTKTEINSLPLLILSACLTTGGVIWWDSDPLYGLMVGAACWSIFTVGARVLAVMVQR